MTTVLSVNSTGSLDKEDRDAARLVVNNDNLRRAANNQPLLPVGTAADVRNSYLTVRSANVTALHIADVALAKTTAALTSSGLTQVQIDQLATAAADRLNNGETFSTILTDIQTP